MIYIWHGCIAGVLRDFEGTRIGLDGVGGMFNDRLIPMCEICSERRIYR